MKKQRLRFKMLALFVFGLFALLAAYGGYSVLTNGDRWFASSHNARISQQKQAVTAGSVLDRDGTALAVTDGEGKRVYAEDATVRRAVLHLLGDGTRDIPNGVEDFHASYLYGFRSSLAERIRLLLSGGERVGDTLVLTVSADLSARLVRAFDAHGVGTGAAVVLNWQTGEILAMVSLPGYDPMAEKTGIPPGAFVNRTTRNPVAPGAAFLPVAAAGGSGGPRALQSAAEDFGYNDNFLFADLVVENSVYPADPAEEKLAERLRGEGGVRATPLHMCMTAAAAANGGAMMTPRLILRVDTPDGKVRATPASAVYRTAFPAEKTDAVRAVFADRGGLRGVSSPACFLGYVPDPAAPWAVCVTAVGCEDAEIPAAIAAEALSGFHENTAP